MDFNGTELDSLFPDGKSGGLVHAGTVVRYLSGVIHRERERLARALMGHVPSEVLDMITSVADDPKVFRFVGPERGLDDAVPEKDKPKTLPPQFNERPIRLPKSNLPPSSPSAPPDRLVFMRPVETANGNSIEQIAFADLPIETLSNGIQVRRATILRDIRQDPEDPEMFLGTIIDVVFPADERTVKGMSREGSVFGFPLTQMVRSS